MRPEDMTPAAREYYEEKAGIIEYGSNTIPRWRAEQVAMEHTIERFELEPKQGDLPGMSDQE
jgi:hypothetical protein